MMLSGSIHTEVKGLVIKLAKFSLISYTPKVRTEIVSYIIASLMSYFLP